jgi:hypothetical protein
MVATQHSKQLSLLLTPKLLAKSSRIPVARNQPSTGMPTTNNEAHEAGGTTIRGPMTPGKAKIKIGHRRFYFFFEDKVNLTIFLYELFSRRTFLVSMFFKPNSMFAIDEESELPHQLLAHVDDMELEGEEKASDDKSDEDEEEYNCHAASQAL